ncbi:MAG: peptidoglycan DD-metalloendopeptidase family protein [Planctomycetota bacterium]
MAVGRDVVAVAPGFVTTGTHDCAGKYIHIVHAGSNGADSWRSSYFHLSAVSVATGQYVFAGTPLGESGNTGSCSGAPHLHFEMRKGPGFRDGIDGVLPTPMVGIDVTGGTGLSSINRFEDGHWYRAVTPQPQTSFSMTVINSRTGTVVPGVNVTWGSYATTTNNVGYFSFASVPCETRPLRFAKAGYVPYEETYTPPCSGSEQTSRGCAPDAPCAGGSLASTTAAPRFQIGDVVEVAGTAIGLRAWQNPCTGTYVVKPDNMIGIIRDQAQCCGGHIRWKIFYDGETVDRWSAEGDPDTGEFWLWKITSTHTVSGNVTHNGAGLGGVVMQGLPGNPSTDSNGNYSALAAAVSAFTVIPTKSGYSFSPPSRAYATLISDQANQNFTATAITNSFTISGDLTIGQSPFSGSVTMNVTPSVPGVPFVGSHDYDVVVPAGWSGTITPVTAGYTFSPSSKSYSNVTSNDSNEDYAVSAIGPGETTLTVNIAPQEAIDDGGGWQLAWFKDGHIKGWFINYSASGETRGLDSLDADTFEVWYKHLENDGWNTPPDATITYAAGTSQTITGSYTRMAGSVTATISPPEANSAGAQWRVAGGPWRDSGFTEQAVLAGFQVVEFKPVAGWLHPINRTISVANYDSVSLADTYIDQGTEPLIVSVSPNSGPLEGGSEVTIAGANFADPAVVTFGGVPATETTVVSQTEIRTKSPARPTIGSVDVVVTSSGATATKQNAFSYLVGVGQGMRLVGHVGGSYETVAVQGNYAYISVGPEFLVMNVINPANPTRAGSLLLGGMIRGIHVSGTRAYVAADDRGVYILDIGNPASPSLLGVYDTPGLAFSAKEIGGLLYVTDFTHGLTILDVTDPAKPMLVGSVAGFGNAYKLDIAVSGNGIFVYVTTYDYATLQVIDVTDPSAPLSRGNFPVPTYATGVDVVGSLAYVVGRGTSLFAINIADSDNLAVVGQSPLQPGYSDVSVINNLAYTIGGTLKVFDVSTPSNMQWINSGTAPVSLSLSRALAISTGRAYVANGEEGFAILNVSNFPITLGGQFTSDAMVAKSVSVANGLAFVGVDNSGLRIFDVTTPSTPYLRGTLNLNAGVSNISAHGAKLYLTTDCQDNGLQVVDVSNPSLPQLRYSSPEDDVCYFGSVVANGLLFTSGGILQTPPYQLFMRVFSLGNPDIPSNSQTASYSMQSSFPRGIVLSSTFAYVAGAAAGLQIVDIGNPNAPMPRGTYTISGRQVASVAVANNFAYVSSFDGDTHVVDVSNHDLPVFVNGWQLASPYEVDLALAGGMLYSAQSFSGVEVRDVASAPTAPPIVATYNTASSARAVAIDGELVYVADGFGGLVILELIDFRPPIIFITNPFSASYATSNSSINIGGAASDDQVVDRVTWLNNRGGSGTAIGTASWDSWTVSNILLKPGPNIITVTAYDGEDNAGSDVITVTYNAPLDVVAPSVVINSPTQSGMYTTGASSIDLAGTAFDDRDVTQVTWANDRGGSGNATGTTDWTIIGIALLTGENVITVTAFDAANNSNAAVLIVTVGDLDQDTVADDDDLCPITIPGIPVDTNGCPPVIAGDVNSDGDVDLMDFAGLPACLSGPGMPHGDIGCVGFDGNKDLHVDLRDFAQFQECFGGTNGPVDCQN